MTLKERIQKILSELSLHDIIYYSPSEYGDSDTGPIASLTEEVAVKFSEWCADKYIHITGNSWSIHGGTPVTTSQLFQQFKKETGL